MIKYVESKRGSSLVMVLIVFSILSVLGVTILSLAVFNFKMKTIDGKVKTAFYLSEAGLDEAYGVMINGVKNAIESGFANVKASYDPWLASQNPNNPLPDPPYNQWFQQGYRNYIQNSLTGLIVSHNYSELDSSLNSAPPIITISQAISYNSTENRFLFQLKSSHTHQNVQKSITAQYKISVPDYSTNLLKKEKIVPLIECKYIHME